MGVGSLDTVVSVLTDHLRFWVSKAELDPGAPIYMHHDDLERVREDTEDMSRMTGSDNLHFATKLFFKDHPLESDDELELGRWVAGSHVEQGIRENE